MKKPLKNVPCSVMLYLFATKGIRIKKQLHNRRFGRASCEHSLTNCEHANVNDKNDDVAYLS